MKFTNVRVTGFENAFIGMRLPMCMSAEEAQSKCDSVFLPEFKAGPKDLDLARRLIAADKAKSYGQPNSKYLRMIHVQMAITAPMYWWKEFDTYKVGTVRNSSSTMHRLTNKEIELSDFEMDDYEGNLVAYNKDGTLNTSEDGDFVTVGEEFESVVSACEQLRKNFMATKDKRYWKELIRILPSSYMQTAMVDLDYATLRNMLLQRGNHKLTEWHTFCSFIKELPYFDELINNI